MEKISSILKSSPRVKSVDMASAAPVRPGAPTYGAPVGRNSVADRITLSERAKDLAMQDTLALRNPKEASRAKMVEEINRNFFESRLDKEEPTVSERAATSLTTAVKLSPSEEFTTSEQTEAAPQEETQSLQGPQGE